MIAIHQPNYIPWLGFFDKARIADCLVLLDNVPYTRGSVINRNKIKTNRGWQWITIPVHHRSDTLIKDVLTLDSGWEQVHWKTLIMNYSKASHFGEISSILCEIYEKRWPRLTELNETIIRLLLDYLNLNPRITRASELEVKGKSSELLVSICRALDDREYLSGTGAREYLDLSLFRKEQIAVKFQEFRSPEYQQLFGQFIPNLSAIDYVFNCGNAKWWLP